MTDPGWLVPVLLLAAVALMWRAPVLGLIVAVLSLTIDLTVIGQGEDGTPLAWGVSHSLFAAALVAAVLRHGVRRFRNWPVGAFVLVFLMNLTVSELHPALTLGYMAACLAVLVLPWCLVQPAWPEQARSLLAFTVAGAAGVSCLLSAIMSVLLPDRPMELLVLFERIMTPDEGRSWLRLAGATGNAGELAMLAFAGLAAALNEAVRSRDPHFAALAVLNLVLILFSGTRGAWLAAAVLVVAFFFLSPSFRRLLLARRWLIGVGLATLAGLLVLDAPNLYHRMFTASGEVNLSMRDQVWGFYFQEWAQAPLFGRGIGAGFVSLGQYVEMRHQTPHNDVLHILVSGGIVGFLLVVSAISLWFRDLHRRSRPKDRPFLIALMLGMLTFSLLWDLVIFPHTLALFAYVAVLELRPSVTADRAPGRSEARGLRRRRRAEPAADYAEAAERPAPELEEAGTSWYAQARARAAATSDDPRPLDWDKVRRRRARPGRRGR